MHIKMDYGRKGLMIDVPEVADVFEVRRTLSVPDEKATIHQALQNPMGSPSLSQIVTEETHIVIIHTDITRATPNRRLLPVILDYLEMHGVKRENITLLNALGTHRPQTTAELELMLGEAVVRNYRCIQHNAFDYSQLFLLGKSQFGNPVKINKTLIESDLVILTGFIEPHFFAGYSGGPKAILPGCAGAETIFANHSPQMIANAAAGFNSTAGNPIWEEIREAALKVPNTFLVNVTLDRENQITGVFAGDVCKAHQHGCNFVRETSLFEIPKLYDLVITSNSGYPLDQNLYQCVKGLAAAKRAVRKGGAILLLGACEEGLPVQSNYAQLLREVKSPQQVLGKVSKTGFMRQDSWQVQVQAQVQQHADVYLYSDGLSDEQIIRSLLKPCRDIQKTIFDLIDFYRDRLCILLQGPLKILDLMDRENLV